ncbi:hypothetical protein CXB51_034614 [Gossypium anomalum]|uniref:Reverse transcriptase domain-containing protein n=1 Tax=Gossypium anomalum TaxID=47600 RepID=A0A8J5Y7M0_9ROSI|nr:hypothetical protein CXB51_034614 [Gossypium anomalum]
MRQGLALILVGQDVSCRATRSDFYGPLVCGFVLGPPPSLSCLYWSSSFGRTMEKRPESDTTIMTEEIIELLERLKFSKDEAVQVININGDKNIQGFESWDVGKIMALEAPNREAMFVIVKFECLEDRSQILNFMPWLFDRCLFSMLPFKKGKDIESYEFWLIYNIPIELMDRQMALDVGNAIGELMVIDWKDRCEGWTEFMRIKVKINVLKPLRRVVRVVDKDGVEKIGLIPLKLAKKTKKGAGLDDSNLQYGSWMRAPIRKTIVKLIRGKKVSRMEIKGSRRFVKRSPCPPLLWKDKCKSKQKRHRGSNGKNTDESLVRLIKRKLLENVSPFKAVASDQPCQDWNCRGVGNLATFRKLKQLLIANILDIIFLCETKIHSNGFHHIRTMCRMDDDRSKLKATILGYVEKGKEYGNFNAIINNSEKEGGRRKPKTLMDDFCDILEELNLTDFTWTNNKDGIRLVKERLDRFVISDVIMEKMSFLTLHFVCQSKFDHEAILMDTNRSKPKGKSTDHRAWFRYEFFRRRSKRIEISSLECNSLEKMELIRDKLGPWQYQHYRRIKYNIKELEKEISKLMDGSTNERSMGLLKNARGKLGHLYDVKEKHWWLKEGDRNTRYFHVRASGHRKKNNIERLKDTHGDWHEDKNEIYHIALKYFNDLFETSKNVDDECDLNVIPKCITEDMNRRLNGEFTNEEILVAFNQMDPQKAPGIDGLLGSFFKDHWSTMGVDVLSLCHDILKGNKSAGCINETLIVLIPKISLCRVIYKIILKTLANRLKDVLPKCISQNQSTFAPSRMIHDNVLVAHKLMHYLRSSKNGPKKGCMVKLDMSKAYDRVE